MTERSLQRNPCDGSHADELEPCISLVTHLPMQPYGGGVYSVTWQVHEQLCRHFRVQPVRPVAPRVSRRDAVWSKFLRRVIHRPGTHYHFSQRTLDRYAEDVDKYVDTGVSAIFFRTVTRWIHCKPTVPYFVHTDIVFHTFVENTFNQADFQDRDFDRICSAERRFLQNAKAVFFESKWGLDKAKHAYGLSGDNFFVIRNGGLLDPPEKDVYSDSPLRLVSVAVSFRTKGGDLILEAFKELRTRYPQLHWHIIGGKPDGDWENVEGVHYEGMLRPSQADELQRFRSVLASAFLLVHPTRQDTNPLVLAEAAYFGCPCVSVNDFAIPEMVHDGQTGVLLDRPVRSSDLVRAIEDLISDRQRYLKMRTEARQWALGEFCWNTSGDQLAAKIKAAL